MHKHPAEFNLQKIYDLDTKQSIQHRTRNIYNFIESDNCKPGKNIFKSVNLI